MKVCFWCTTFQADVQALAYHLAARPDMDVLVAMDHPESYLGEPFAQILPFPGRFIDKSQRTVRREVERFAPDLLIVDNHLPTFRVAPFLFVLWHGFGWRFDDLTQMRRELKQHVGDVTQPNSNFRWQAFGEWDRNYRIQHSRLSPENVVALGSAYSDWLLPGSLLATLLDRERLQPSYTIDLRRPTVLLALTWHHGGSFGHWGEEEDLLTRLITHVTSRGANLLIRMHDRHRYEQAYLLMIEKVAQDHPGVEVKFKNTNPDSFLDLRLSDVMVSNYSSILNAFYYTRKPSLHIDPTGKPGTLSFYRQLKRGRVRKVPIEDPSQSWKLPPDQIGGIRTRSFEELLEGVGLALADASCCDETARRYVSEYVTGADGTTCERIATYLREAFT